jgi:putative oxidoreductase
MTMDVVRGLARPMLGSMFVLGGLDAFRNPESKVPKAKDVVATLSESLGLPGDTVTLVRVNGAVQMAAGLALAAGKVPRVAALALAASLVPTTLAGHPFWKEADAKARAAQRIQFFKNVSMFGGLVLAADDTGGRPSIPWRIHEAVDHARDGLPHALSA